MAGSGAFGHTLQEFLKVFINELPTNPSLFARSISESDMRDKSSEHKILN